MISKKGRLIVIEGSDGSGKATQTQLLTKALKQKGIFTTSFSFPRYKESEFGGLIRRSLDGEFGNFLELSPYLSSLPYVLDRARAKYLIQEALKSGDVICDRYTPSNLAHQSVKLPIKEQKKFIKFIENGEYIELGLPKPDLVIYLFVPLELTRKLISKRSKKRKSAPDQHERAFEYLENVIKMYLKLAKERKDWHIVQCTGSKGRFLSKKEIHLKIMKIITNNKRK